MRTRVVTAILAALAVCATTGVAASYASVDVAAKSFANCTALNKVYPHGVGKWGAKDHTSGQRVTTFKRSNDLYRANKGSDRDGDGIACEKL
jgi:hypothetical protein